MATTPSDKTLFKWCLFSAFGLILVTTIVNIVRDIVDSDWYGLLINVTMLPILMLFLLLIKRSKFV